MPITGLVAMNNRGSVNSYDTESLDSKQQRSGYTLESPLAKQLQRALLHTQLPKRDVPKLDFLSPVASRSSSSTSFQASPSDSHSYTGQSDAASFSPGTDNDTGAESDPMDGDYVFLQYLTNMMMEEDIADRKCMYQQCSAYEALNKELADLIGSDATDDNYCETEERVSADNSWIDEVLSSRPFDFLSDGLSELTTRDLTLPGSLPTNTQPLPKQLYGDLEAFTCADVDRERGEPAQDYANGMSGIESLNELYPLVMQCAQAVAADDVIGANALINELRMRSSIHGDGGQRLTYYFVEALVARLSGTGAQLYTAMSANRPSRAQMLEAYRMLLLHNPSLKICHFLTNKTICKAIEGAEKVHIIDYGIFVWSAMAVSSSQTVAETRRPPRVRITGIDFAQPGFRKSEDVEETGRRLAETAKQFGVDFEYHAIAGKWETIQPAQFNIRKDEVLIVNSVLRLRNLLDETVMASNPKKMVLQKSVA